METADHGADSAQLIRVLKADGTEAPIEVTYPKDKTDDVAKKQFTVTLSELEGGSYTLVLGANMQANNGTTLGENVTVSFTVKAAEVVTRNPTLWTRVKQFFLSVLDWFRTLWAKIEAQAWYQELKTLLGGLL